MAVRGLLDCRVAAVWLALARAVVVVVAIAVVAEPAAALEPPGPLERTASHPQLPPALHVATTRTRRLQQQQDGAPEVSDGTPDDGAPLHDPSQAVKVSSPQEFIQALEDKVAHILVVDHMDFTAADPMEGLARDTAHLRVPVETRSITGACSGPWPTASQLRLPHAALLPGNPGQCLLLFNGSGIHFKSLPRPSAGGAADDGDDGDYVTFSYPPDNEPQVITWPGLEPVWLNNVYLRDTGVAEVVSAVDIGPALVSAGNFEQTMPELVNDTRTGSLAHAHHSNGKNVMMTNVTLQGNGEGQMSGLWTAVRALLQECTLADLQRQAAPEFAAGVAVHVAGEPVVLEDCTFQDVAAGPNGVGIIGASGLWRLVKLVRARFQRNTDTAPTLTSTNRPFFFSDAQPPMSIAVARGPAAPSTTTMPLSEVTPEAQYGFPAPSDNLLLVLRTETEEAIKKAVEAGEAYEEEKGGEEKSSGGLSTGALVAVIVAGVLGSVVACCIGWLACTGCGRSAQARRSLPKDDVMLAMAHRSVSRSTGVPDHPPPGSFGDRSPHVSPSSRPIAPVDPTTERLDAWSPRPYTAGPVEGVDTTEVVIVDTQSHLPSRARTPPQSRSRISPPVAAHADAAGPEATVAQPTARAPWSRFSWSGLFSCFANQAEGDERGTALPSAPLAASTQPLEGSSASSSVAKHLREERSRPASSEVRAHHDPLRRERSGDSQASTSEAATSEASTFDTSAAKRFQPPARTAGDVAVLTTIMSNSSPSDEHTTTRDTRDVTQVGSITVTHDDPSGTANLPPPPSSTVEVTLQHSSMDSQAIDRGPTGTTGTTGATSSSALPTSISLNVYNNFPPTSSIASRSSDHAHASAPNPASAAAPGPPLHATLESLAHPNATTASAPPSSAVPGSPDLSPHNQPLSAPTSATARSGERAGMFNPTPSPTALHQTVLPNIGSLDHSGRPAWESGAFGRSRSSRQRGHLVPEGPRPNSEGSAGVVDHMSSSPGVSRAIVSSATGAAAPSGTPLASLYIPGQHPVARGDSRGGAVRHERRRSGPEDRVWPPVEAPRSSSGSRPRTRSPSPALMSSRPATRSPSPAVTPSPRAMRDKHAVHAEQVAVVPMNPREPSRSPEPRPGHSSEQRSEPLYGYEAYRASTAGAASSDGKRKTQSHGETGKRGGEGGRSSGHGRHGRTTEEHTAEGEEMDNLKAHLNYQLNSLADKMLLGKYVFATIANNRRQGRKAVVQIVEDKKKREQVAIKFYLSQSTFQHEKALYRDPSHRALAAFLPELLGVVNPPGPAGGAGGGGEDACIRDPTGERLPPCIVMEKGEPLDLWADNCTNGIDVVTGLQVLSHIAATLSDLHAAGYTHCDIKASNVMWLPRQKRWTLSNLTSATPTGHGYTLSRSFSHETRSLKTKDGKPLGKPARPATRSKSAPLELALAAESSKAFWDGHKKAGSRSFWHAAPEAVEAYLSGEGVITASEALDAWSLGILVIQIFTGQAVFDSKVSSEKVAAMILGKEKAPWEDPKTARPLMRRFGHLKSAVLPLLDRDPSKRPSMAALCRSCQNVLSHTTTTDYRMFT